MNTGKQPTIIQYYTEDSRTKSQRRQEILEATGEVLNAKGYDALTMKDIAKILVIERRTLYAYYNNKADLMVDAYLYMIEKLGQLYTNDFSTMQKSVYNLPLESRLKEGLNQYGLLLVKMWENHPFLFEYEPILRGIDQKSPTLDRFLKIRSILVDKDNSILHLLNPNTHQDNPDQSETSVKLFKSAMVAEQSLRAYVVQIARRKDFVPHYSLENISTFVELLIPGLIKDYSSPS